MTWGLLGDMSTTARFGGPLLASLLLLGLLLVACSSDRAAPTPTGTSEVALPLFPGATPVTPSGGPSSANPLGIGIEEVEALVTLEEVREIVALPVNATPVRDVRLLLESQQGSSPVAAMDSWYSRSFISEDTTQAVSFSLVDYRTQGAASGQYALTVVELGLFGTPTIIGEGSGQKDFREEPEEPADVLLVVFYKGDKYLELQSVGLPSPETRLIEMDGLLELAQLLASRL